MKISSLLHNAATAKSVATGCDPVEHALLNADVAIDDVLTEVGRVPLDVYKAVVVAATHGKAPPEASIVEVLNALYYAEKALKEAQRLWIGCAAGAAEQALANITPQPAIAAE